MTAAPDGEGSQGQTESTPSAEANEAYYKFIGQRPPPPPRRRRRRGCLGGLIGVAALGVLALGVWVGLAALRSRSAHKATADTAKTAPSATGQTAIATSPESSAVNIVVPEGSRVEIHSDADTNASVVSRLTATSAADALSRRDGWVQVTLKNSDGLSVEGWVDADFIEERWTTPSTVTSQPASTPTDSATPSTPAVAGAHDPVVAKASEGQPEVEIAPTSAGFIRVFDGPFETAKELTKVSPGERYPFVARQGSWITITLDDGSSGWIPASAISVR